MNAVERERTRFADEAERVKDAYETMSTLADATRAGWPGGDAEVDELAELIRGLAGFDPKGRYDPDLHTVHRQAAYRWLTERGYIK